MEQEYERQLRLSRTITWSAVIAGLVIIALIIYWFNQEIKTATAPSVTKDVITNITFTTEEPEQIDDWLTNQALNLYGDKLGTAEPNANLLVNPYTGDPYTRYEYLVKKFPDRPWRKFKLSN